MKRRRLRIKELAQEKGFSQSSLARATGLGFNTIKELYRNPYRHAWSDTLYRVADALGVKLDDLFEEFEEESQEPKE